MNKQAKLLVREVASLIVIKEAIARKIIKILQELDRELQEKDLQG